MVSAQPTAPSKSGVCAVRDAGGQNTGEQTAEGEDGFGDVLSKLQKSDSDEPAVSKDRPRIGERTNTRRHDVEAQLLAEAGRADPNVTSAPNYSENDRQPTSDPHQEGAGAAQPDAAQVQAIGIDATIASDIAAVIPTNLVQPSAKGAADAPTRSSTEREAADPSAAVGEMHSDKTAATEARARLQAEGAAKGELGNFNSGPLAAASDPMVARLNPRGSSIDKDKFERAQRSQTPVAATDLSMSPPADGAAELAQRLEIPAPTQRPKANVVRQETHFAPVSTLGVGSQAGVSAGDGSKSATAPEVVGGAEPAASSPVIAVAPSFEDLPSIATPPSQQIADRIATEATSAPEFAERTGVASPMAQGMKPTLKILQIQLQPADLGVVTVRMELKNTELTLHVEADRKETADLIRNDQDTLSNLLRSAGYNVDAGSVRIVEGDKTLASQQSGQQGAQANLQSSSQSQSGASDRQGHAQRGSAGTNGGETGHQPGRNDTHETTTNRTGLGVYV
jgi:chemotaxis protein MotD